MVASKTIDNSNEHEIPNDTEIAERDNIRHLVNDLNRSLGDYAPSDAQNTDTEETVDTDEEPKQNKKSDFSLFCLVKDQIIIILLYILISQNFVKNGLGTYIPQILPKQDCSTSFVGTIICGVLLALLYTLAKKIV